MAAPDYAALAAVVIANLSVDGAGISMPQWEQIKNRVQMLQGDFTQDIPRTVTPDDIDGLAAALIAGGCTAPADLEQVGNIVSTYPYTRASNDVLDVPTS